MKRYKPLFALFVVASAVMLFGVLVFFKPISELDFHTFAVSPSVGLLVYMGLSAMIFQSFGSTSFTMIIQVLMQENLWK